MGFGDELLAAGEAQRFYDDLGKRSVIVDVKGRRRWHPIWDGNPVIVRPDEHTLDYLTILNAPHARPYIVYPFTAETGWTFNRGFHARDHRARIYLTDAEKSLGLDVARGGPFILIDPWSKHANLRWPLDYWQAMVDDLSVDLRFVQHVYGDAPRLANIEHVETPSFRLACGVLNAAQLYIRGESGMAHAAAALSIPQVTIWGACMDWDVLGGYDKQIGVGVGEHVCGRYQPCTHCVQTMRAITPDMVVRAIDAQLTCYGLR